ncbi:hypothetical protein F994_01444 [Acinetobacter bohemicus ANC 3994]|uniref:Membrane-anchored protein n=1 Tax=Acinetobacter bohemicus ANC 3994 TaxID=1217715 RepID=N8P1U0_9GAMM|nr:hypothetical protein [Acinetobacter bohemicus]ENU20385.1 hypothetical protein F994_01444 [Acinetobacter bohemicus ANC 3994]
MSQRQSLITSLSKVPEITALFWMTKIFATTFGETAGDAVSMSLNWGYLVGTAIFAVLFILLLYFQVSAKTYRPYLYWFTIIASTTVGTTLADFVDRSLGIGYIGGSTLLLSFVLLCLWVWYKSEGSISPHSVNYPRAEIFYWLTITFSQTLGTALGDWSADTAGLGYSGGIVLYVSLIALIAGLYFFSQISRTLLFWSAFVLTRPLGAVVGDFLDKPLASGGLDLSRFGASAVILTAIIICIHFAHRPATKNI